MGGHTMSGMGGDKSQAKWGTYTYDYWIVKTDSIGQKMWDKDFGGTGDDYLFAIQQTHDDGYILGGYSASNISGDKSQNLRGDFDYWIVKTDALGNKQWDRDYGGTVQDYLYSVIQTFDGGYLLGGTSLGNGGDKTQLSRGNFDYWIVKTDSNGLKLWDRRFGGDKQDELYTMTETADHGYLLAGISYSGIVGDKTSTPHGWGDIWVVKIDSNGTKLWDKGFGSSWDDIVHCVIQPTDGGYILAGRSDGTNDGEKSEPCKGLYDYWIIKIDSLGNKQWDKDFGGSQHDINDKGNIIQTIDGGYLISGVSYNNVNGDKTENNLGPEQGWFVKIDAGGNKQWDKTILTNGTDQRAYVADVDDRCYVFASYTLSGIAGYKTEDNRDTSNKTTDYWIIKYCDTSTFIIPPAISAFTTSDTMLCSNECISFSNQSIHSTSYQWYFAGGNPSSSAAQNPSVCYPAAGTFDVTLIASNAGGKDSMTMSNYIRVKTSPPTPTLELIGTTIYSSTDPAYSSYQWFDSTALITGATDTFLLVTHSGNYNLQVSNADSCKTAVGINIVLTGTENSMIGKNVFIFPNPSGDNIHIYGLSSEQRTTIQLFNTLGEKMIERIDDNYQMTGIDIHSLPSGIYFVRIEGERQRWNGRFVKE